MKKKRDVNLTTFAQTLCLGESDDKDGGAWREGVKKKPLHQKWDGDPGPILFSVRMID